MSNFRFADSKGLDGSLDQRLPFVTLSREPHTGRGAAGSPKSVGGLEYLYTF